MAALRELQQRIANATRVGEQTGSVALIVGALHTAHGLVSGAEQLVDVAMREAEAESARLRQAYATAQHQLAAQR